MAKRRPTTSTKPAKAAQLRIALRVVYYREAGRWVAHCLEFDLAGDGRTRQFALVRLLAAIVIQIKEAVASANMQNLFSPADGEVFRKFAAGKKSMVIPGDAELSANGLRIEKIEIRDYAELAAALA